MLIKKYEAAIEAYKKSIALQPCEESYSNLLSMLNNLKKYDEGLDEYNNGYSL